MKEYKRGLAAGIPIALAYLSVSFSFGILAISYGLTWKQALIVSMLTLTSAGQFAGVRIMVQPAQYISMAVSQLTINLRYSFMGMSLSQRLSPGFKGIIRWLLGFFITDEIFAVASAEKVLGVSFFMGLVTLPYIGWTLGTLLGGVMGSILPAAVMSALGLALYGMFVALVVPDMKDRRVLIVVCIAAAVSSALYFVPFLSKIPTGIAISLSAIIAAAVGAFLFPHSVDAEEDAEGEVNG